MNSALPDLKVRYIESERLWLVPATVELIAADLVSRAQLATALGVKVPDNWPPELYDRPAMQYAQRQLESRAERGWSFWYLVGREDPQGEVLGICGFKGRPDARGAVEIGYSLMHQFRRRGFASEAVTRLVNWAFSHANVLEVCAETLPHLTQSIRVLEGCGFRRAGKGSEHGVIRFAIYRNSFN